MTNTNYEYELFYTREGFNRSLGHFQSVSGIVQQSKANLADLLVEGLSEGDLTQSQINPIIYALLVDKYNYRFASENIKDNFDRFEEISNETRKWNAIDLVGTYIHPELGFLVFNPKNPEHLKALQIIKKNEIVTVYAGAFGGRIDEKTADKAIDSLFSIIAGKKKATPAELLKGSIVYKAKTAKTAGPSKAGKERRTARPSQAGVSKKPAPVSPAGSAAPVPATGPRRMTPMYSIPVSNELFHNGNVEAWKRIIRSYTDKYPQCEVYIFYDGERIHDINALFKWGKVKHGSVIIFAVAGENIRDVAKLQRYLIQGASPRFEDFLRFPVNTVLNLF